MKPLCLCAMLTATLLACMGEQPLTSYAPSEVSSNEVRARLENMPATHPRLFVDNAETFLRLKNEIAASPARRLLRDGIIQQADRVMNEAPAKRVQQGMRMQGQHEVETRVALLAMAYRLTEKTAYAERAKQELLAAADFDNWNPSHFLDTAEMTLGVALGYDWLYDTLDQPTRARLCKAIREKGLKPALAKTYFWTTGDNNWSQVCWGGLVAGALAVYNQDSDLATDIIHRAVTSVPSSIRPYAPNGSYPEGPGYWTYGTTYYVYMLDLLRHALGTDFGLYDLPGFPQTGDYINIVTAPSGRFYNYADSSDKRGPLTALWWLAQQSNRPDWLRFEAAPIREAVRLNDPRPLALGSQHMLPLALLWYHDTDAQATIRIPLNWASGGHVPLAIMRTSWEDPNAGYLATKGGPASQNHGHMDAGSFIYEADGVRWAVDLGSQSYYSLEKLGLNIWDKRQKADRWKVFRINSLSHNLVTIDGQPHVVDGAGKMIAFDPAPRQPHAVLDLSEVYAGQARRVLRACALLPSRTAVIQDRLTGVTPGAVARWAMVTGAPSHDVRGNDLVLRDGERTLTLRVESPADIAWSITDLTTPAHSWDAPNKGMSLVSFTRETPPDGTLAFRVLLIPGQPKETPAAADFLAGAE